MLTKGAVDYKFGIDIGSTIGCVGLTSGGSKNVEWGGGGRRLSAPSSFRPIANAHNEIYAFYTEKAAFLKKKT